MHDSVVAALALLPPWVSYGPLLTYPALAAMTALVGHWLGLRLSGLPRRPLGDAIPWQERARVLWSARRGGLTSLLVLGMLFVPLAILFAGTERSLAWALGVGLAGAVAGLGTATWVHRRMLRGHLPARTFGEDARNVGVLICAMYAPLLGLLIAGLAMPAELGWSAGLVLVLTTAAVVFLSVGGGLFLAGALGLARPASSRLHAIVARAAGAVPMEPPPAYELRWTAANAFAFPLLGRVAFSQGAMEHMSDVELESICAHELDHLRENRRLSVARAGAMVGLLPFVFTKPLVMAFQTELLLGLFVAWVVYMLVLRRFTRRAEVSADEAAHSHGDDPAVYARALERLYEINLLPAVLSKGGSHPDLYDRMEAAGASPDYPRPAHPSRRRTLAAAFLPALSATVLLLCVYIGVGVGCSFTESTAASKWEMALTGVNRIPLVHLGVEAWDAGEHQRAETFFRAATSISYHADPPARLAALLSEQGRCEEAGLQAMEAEMRYQEGGGGDRDTIDWAFRWLESCDSTGAS